MFEDKTTKEGQKKEPDFLEKLRTFPALRKLTFPEVLFFVNVYQKRVQRTLKNVCSLKTLEGLIACANILPFSLLEMVQALSNKYYTAVAADHLLHESIVECRPQSAIESIAQGVASNKQNVKRIQELKKVFLNEPCRVITPKYQDLQTYQKQSEFLDGFYEEISEYLTEQGRSSRTTPSKGATRTGTPVKGLNLIKGKISAIPLAKAIDLYEKAGKLHFPNDFEQLSILRDLINSSKNLLDADHPGLEASKSRTGSPRRPLVTEIVPASLLKASPNKTGRPKTSEKIEKQIREDYENRRARVRSFKSIDAAKEELDKALALGDTKTAESLKSDLLSVEVWKEDFERVLKNNGVLGPIVSIIEMPQIYVPEMSQILAFRREWNLWMNEVNNMHRKMNKKVNDIFDNKEEMVTYTDLEELVNREKNIKHMELDDEIFPGILKKFQTLTDIRRELNNSEEPPTYKRLKEIRSELAEINVRIKELEFIKDSIKYNEKTDRLIQQSINLDDLDEELLKLEGKRGDIDQELYQDLKQKSEEGHRLVKEAERFSFENALYTIDEIGQMAKLVSRAKKYQLELDEIKPIHRYVDEFLMVSEAYSKTVGGLDLDRKKLEEGDYIEFKDLTIEDLTQNFQRLLKEDADVINNDNVEELYEVFFKKNIHDPNIYNFIEIGKTVVWRKRVLAFLREGSKKTLKDLKQLNNEAPEVEQRSSEDADLLDKIRGAEEKVQNWKDHVENFSKEVSKDKLLKQIEKLDNDITSYDSLTKDLYKYFDVMTELSQEYHGELNMYTDLQEDMQTVTESLDWLDWVLQACKLRNRVHLSADPIAYETVVRIHKKAKELEIPEECSFKKLISEWYKRAKKSYEEFEKKYLSKRVAATNINLDGTSIKKLFDKNRNKLTIREAQKLATELKTDTDVIIFPEQAKMISKDIQRLKDWNKEVRAVTNKHFKQTRAKEAKEDMVIEEDSDLKRDLNSLRIDMLDIPIRSEAMETEFMELCWIYEVSTMLNGVNKNIPYVNWKKTYQMREDFAVQDNDIVKRLIEALENELEIADRIRAFHQALKKLSEGKSEQKLPYEELLVIVEYLNQSKILLKDEKNNIEFYFGLTQGLREKAYTLLHPAVTEKAFKEEFEKLSISMENLPIDLSYELDLVERVIKDATKLQNKIKNNLDEDNLEEMEDIVIEYMISPIFNDDAVRITRLFETQSYSRSFSAPRPSKTRIGQLKSFLSDYADMDKKKNGVRTGPIIDYNRNKLRNHARLGYDLQRSFPDNDELQKATDFIIGVLKEVDQEINKIHKEYNPDALDLIPNRLFGFVNLSSELEERRNAIKSRGGQRAGRSGPGRRGGRPRKEATNDRTRSLSEERYQQSKERSREREKKPSSTSKDKPEGKVSRSRKDYQEKISRARKDLDDEPKVLKMAESDKKRLEKHFSTPNKDSVMYKGKQYATSEIQKILSECNYITMKYTETFTYAGVILNAFPEILEHKKTYARIMERLRTLFESREFARSIDKMKFSGDYIRNLVSQTPSDLKAIEYTLKEEAITALVNKNFSGVASKKTTPNKSQTLEKSITDDPYENLPNVKRKEKSDRKASGSHSKASGVFKNPTPKQSPTFSRISRESPKFQIEEPDASAFHPADVEPVQEPLEVDEPPKNSVLKIFSGSLSWEEGRTYPKMGMYTCDRVGFVKRIPKLTEEDQSELSVAKEVPYGHFEEYFDSALKERRAKAREVIISSGWIEPEVAIYNGRFEQISQYCTEKERVVFCYIGDSTRVIILSKKQMINEWIVDLDLQTRPSRNLHVYLYFIIVHKPDKLKKAVEFINPELTTDLPAVEADQDPADLDSLEASPQSEGSSLGGRETDFGAEVIRPDLERGASQEEVKISDDEYAGDESLLNKRPYPDQYDEEDDKENFEILSKKLKVYTVDGIIAKLKNLEQDEILSLGGSLTDAQRGYMIKILSQDQEREEQLNQAQNQEVEYDIAEDDQANVSSFRLDSLPASPKFRSSQNETVTKDGHVLESSSAEKPLISSSMDIQDFGFDERIKFTEGTMTLPRDLYEQALNLQNQQQQTAEINQDDVAQEDPENQNVSNDEKIVEELEGEETKEDKANDHHKTVVNEGDKDLEVVIEEEPVNDTQIVETQQTMDIEPDAENPKSASEDAEIVIHDSPKSKSAASEENKVIEVEEDKASQLHQGSSLVDKVTTVTTSVYIEDADQGGKEQENQREASDPVIQITETTHERIITLDDSDLPGGDDNAVDSYIKTTEETITFNVDDSSNKEDEE